MSLYNMLNGVTPATFFILPMLGKHPDEYPRFRDCFLADPEHPEYDDHIHVYTRTGGGNRKDYEAENKEMTCHPNYITDFDDGFDSTYASFIFSVPEKWKADFETLVSGKISDTSREYQEMVKSMYPKLKHKLDEIFEAAAKEE